MCRFVAYIGAPVFPDTILSEPRASLVAQAMAAREAKTVVNADGCGLAWYGERATPGLFRSTLPAWSDPNLASLTTQIRARLFLAHVRSATDGEVTLSNCHPFAVGRAVFMHNGQIGGFRRLRPRIEALIDEDRFEHRRGCTDSEALFLAALSHGLADDPVAALDATFAAVARVMAAAGEARPLRCAAAYSDGERLWAVRYATDPMPPSLYLRRAASGVIVASEPYDEAGADWTALAPDAVAEIGPDGRITEHRLSRAAAAA